MKTNISRRNLIKGGAAFAAAATLLGASACSPQKEAENASAAKSELPADLRASDFKYSVVETDPITSFASEETYDIVVIGAGCAGVPAVLTAVEEGATVACLQKEATVSANGNGCSFVVKEAYSSIRTNLLFSQKGEDCPIFVVTILPCSSITWTMPKKRYHGLYRAVSKKALPLSSS